MKHIFIFMAFWLMTMGARAQTTDTTTISHQIGTSYVGLFDTLYVSFSFKEPTIAVEGRLTFDSSKMLFLGALNPANMDELGTTLLFSNSQAFARDTTVFVVGWSLESLTVDSLAFVFAPISAGTHTAALSFLKFDEREPANDGISYYPMISEVRPLEEFGGFVNTEDYIEKIEACEYIRNWYYPEELRGDASGNGELSVLDASLILQVQALVIDRLPDSAFNFVLPAFCDN